MRCLRRAVVIVTGTIALATLTGCARPAAESPPAPKTSDPPSQAGSTATPSPAPGQAPDGTPIPGGKPIWIDGLPDPSGVDRTDPEAVISAYVTTAATWDTTLDKTSAYATQRAAIYLTAALRAAAARYDPDTATGQAEFTQAAQHDASSAVTIRDIAEEGLDVDQDGEVHRIVHTLVTITPRDGTAPSVVVSDVWVTATKENGQWAITSTRTQT